MDTYSKDAQKKGAYPVVNINEIYNKPARPAAFNMPVIAEIPVVLSCTECRFHVEAE